LRNLHHVAQDLVRRPEDAELLRRIAWNTLNILAADVVTIYEYIETERQFVIPPHIAGRLRAETGQPFAGQASGRLDFAIRVSRTRQRQAALLHASQVSPEAPLWRRLELQGDTGHLRWLAPRRPERSRHCVRGEHRVRRGTERASRAGHGQCRQCRRR